jgi:O-succinylbenzoic acid--CoA ligase
MLKFENASYETKNEVVRYFEKIRSREVIRLYTSGSTGTPRPVDLQPAFLERAARDTNAFFGLGRGVKALLCLPVNKVGGLMMVARALYGGYALTVTDPRARPLEQVAGDFDFVSMVPYQALESGVSLERVKTLLLGGASIPPGWQPPPGPRIYQSYGMTETLSHVALRHFNSKEEQAYQALPGVELSQDADNCLIIDAPKRGVNNLRTRDVVALLEGGKRFFYKGRRDNAINSGGLKFFPETLEARLVEMPVPFFITGMPHERLGEALTLVVEGEELEEATIKQAAAALAGKEKIRMAYRLPRFDYTESGKLHRRRTRERLLEGEGLNLNW